MTTPAAAPLLETHPGGRDRHPVRQARRGPGPRAVSGGWAAGSGPAATRGRTCRTARGARRRWRCSPGAGERIGFADSPAAADLYPARAAAGGRARGRAAAGARPAATARPRRPVRLALTADDRAAADAWLRERGIAAGFVAAGAGIDLGHQAVAGLRRAGRARSMDPIVVVGGPEDARAGRGRRGRGAGPGAQRRGRARRSAASAALIARAAVLVTNDSAPLHLATAVGTPIVAVFGPTVPAFGFGPRGPRDAVVEHPSLACRPCSAHGPQAVPAGPSPLHAGAVGRRRSPRGGGRRQAWRRIVRFVLGIDIGGTNLVVGSVAEDGSRRARHRERADACRGGRQRRAGPAGGAGRSAPSTRPGARRPAREILGVGVGAPGAARHQARHRAAHAQPRLGEPPAAPDHPRPAGPPRRARQRRQLRRARRVVGRRRARRAARHRHHHRHRHRRRAHPRRQAVPRRVGRRRRDRAHDDRHRGPPLQVRQLRLPRGVRLGSQHRAARGRGDRGRRGEPAAVAGGRRPLQDHRADRLSGGRTTATTSPSRS